MYKVGDCLVVKKPFSFYYVHEYPGSCTSELGDYWLLYDIYTDSGKNGYAEWYVLIHINGKKAVVTANFIYEHFEDLQDAF